jgi:16S rRNA (guanine527-N7)-methyltransferase
MNAGELVKQYFPGLNEKQYRQFDELPKAYQDWNDKINVVSRKDVAQIKERHLLHALSLAFFWHAKNGQSAIDIGTGGGFPGIPLAILYPDVKFLLVDSTAKKIKVVQEVADFLGLQNVSAIHERAEKVKGNFDVAMVRAVSKLDTLIRYCTNSNMQVAELYCLKGGDLSDEIQDAPNFDVHEHALKDRISLPFFETKKVLHIIF